MNADERFDATVSGWLHDRAGQGSPAYLDDILGRTARTTQRPAWTFFERWIPVDITTRANLFAPPRPGRVLLVVLLLAALLVGAVAFVGSQRRPLPAPFGPAANGSIVYDRYGDVFLAHADGSGERSIASGATIDVGPQYAYDGTRFAFLRQVGNRTLQFLVANADGTDIRPLGDGTFVDPDWWDWSPDGSSLVVMHKVDNRTVLSILPTDGTGQARQLDVGPMEADGPSWLPPNGQEIVFRGRTFDGIRTAVYGIHPDGTGLHALTPELDVPDAYENLRPSPDGSAVTYTKPFENGARSYVLDLGTGVEHVIGAQDARWEVGPKFSPDGSQVMYIAYQDDLPSRVMLAPADGTGDARQVGPGLPMNGDFYFEFSPDGAKALIYDRKATSTSIVDIAGGTVETGSASDGWASWQRLAP